MKNHEEILKLFASDDEMRPILCNPFSAGDYVVSTDGYAIVFIPKSEVDADYADNKLSPACLEHLNIPESLNFEISTSVLKEFLNTLPKIDEALTIENVCEVCNGEGEVEYEFYHDRHYYEDLECPVCRGTGVSKVTKTLTGKMVTDPKANIQINGRLLHFGVFDKLVKAVELLEVPTFKLVSQKEPIGQVIYTVGLIKVLLMPITAEDGPVFNFPLHP